MKSNRITKKLNKLAKNKTSKKCKLEKRISKKHVKSSIEKKSRKMRGGKSEINTNTQQPVSELTKMFEKSTQNEFYDRPTLNGTVTSKSVVTDNPGYARMKRNEVELAPYNNSSPIGELELFHDVVEKIIKLLEIEKLDPDAIKELKDALNRQSSLSAEELLKLQEKLEQLIDKYQPLYAEINGEKVGLYEQVQKPSPPLPERTPRRTFRNLSYEQSLESSCSNKSKKDCEESPECELVKTKTRGKFGLYKTVRTCVRKETITPQPVNQIYEQPMSVKQTDEKSPYIEADNRSQEKGNNGPYVAFAPANLGGQN